jgi:hypothetical protein
MSRGRGNGNIPCTIEDCGGRQVGQGLCDKHYRRLRRYGDPRITKRIIGDIEARWWSKVDRRGDDECWPWKDKPNTEGYAVFGVGQKVVKAARWGYERFVSPIPPGQMPDHTCHDPKVCNLGKQCPHRMCVNWHHLELVENRENVLRGQRAKISDEYVAELLARYKSGERLIDLAREAGVHSGTIVRRFGMLSTM